MRWWILLAWLVAVAVWVAREGPVSPYDSPELTELLDRLCDRALRDDTRWKERAKAETEIRELVRRGGPALVREAVERMPRERRRSQMILALADDVRVDTLRTLRDARDPLVHLYPVLRGEPRPPAESGGGADADHAMREVAEEVRRRLWPDPEPASPALKEEYVQEWRNEIRPRLRAWHRHVPPEDCHALAEDVLLIVARDLGGTHFFHDYRCAAVLSRAFGRWRLAGLFRLRENEKISRVVVEDFDGDGKREGAIFTDLIGGWCWKRLVVIGADCPDGAATRFAYSMDGGVRVLAPVRAGDPHRFAACDLHLPMVSGHALYGCGVIALECRVFEWNGRGLEEIGSIYTPARY